MSALKIAAMTNEQLIDFFELWARGRKNVDEVKEELLHRLAGGVPQKEESKP